MKYLRSGMGCLFLWVKNWKIQGDEKADFNEIAKAEKGKRCFALFTFKVDQSVEAGAVPAEESAAAAAGLGSPFAEDEDFDSPDAGL